MPSAHNERDEEGDDHSVGLGSSGTADCSHAHEPMTYRDWCKAIDIISALMSPRDSEWQTVNGLDYLETATALTSITSKIDLAFGGTRINPAIGPDQKRRE